VTINPSEPRFWPAHRNSRSGNDSAGRPTEQTRHGHLALVLRARYDLADWVLWECATFCKFAESDAGL